MHHTKRFFAVAVAGGLLASLPGCTTMTPPAAKQSTVTWDTRKTLLEHLQSWQINGKIAVITAKDAGTASVDWTQHADNFNISLYGPFGANAIKLNGGPGHVSLKTSDGKTSSATSAEQLLAQQWGWHLPLSSLKYWVRGLPVPNVPQQSTLDSAHRLATLTQQGYNIQYQGYTSANGIDLPQHLSITSPTIKSKIVIYQWKTS